MMVLDVHKLEQSVQTTLSLFQIFIICVGAVAFCIAFFMLLISTTSNIKENFWEFGVLRAIGLRKDQIIRIYLYESMAVTISASILGLIVGFILAATLSLQFNIFLELPYTIEFPNTLVIIMLSLALLTTAFGTILPLKDVNKRSIAGILKSAG